MNRLILAMLATLFAAHLSYAQAPAATPPAGSSCETLAVGKDGKPLSGAAKTSFLKKCKADNQGASSCEAKAVDKNGKPLAGAAKTSFLKKCEADAGSKK